MPRAVAEFCVPARCGLCRLKLVDGEMTVVVKKDGTVVSGKLPFGRIMAQQGLYCVDCYGGCWHRGEKAVGCHAECLNFVPPEFRPALFEATQYQYQPTADEEGRRRRWLQLRWSKILHAAYPLPLELCDNIAQYCIRPYAAMIHVEPPPPGSACPPLASSQIELSAKVWARYVRFEGLRYVSFLTNQQPSTTDESEFELVFDPSSDTMDTVYFAENHLGVRELLFTSESEMPTIPERSDIWWRPVILPGSAARTFTTQTDGIKLRTLTPAYYRPTTWTRALWSSPPNPPAGKLWNDSLIKLSNPGSLRLSTMVTSDARVTGYSVCRARNLLAMHAHTPGEETGFYQAEAVQNMFAVWQYMPVDVGEVITEVWQRKERLSGYTTLLFTTNKGRNTVLGLWLATRGSRWTFMNRPDPQDLSRVFYQTSQSGISVVSFEPSQPSAPADDRQPVVPTPLSRYPECRAFYEDYYYTTAALDDINLVTPCRRRIGGTLVVTGLLLRDASGHISCVGQVRTDSLDCPLEVSPATSQMLWLGLSPTNMGGHCVISVIVARPSEMHVSTTLQASTWLDLPFRGKLEWWYSFRQCKIHHENQESPATCPTPVDHVQSGAETGATAQASR